MKFIIICGIKFINEFVTVQSDIYYEMENKFYDIDEINLISLDIWTGRELVD